MVKDPARLDWQVVEQKLPLLASLPSTARAFASVEALEVGQVVFRAGATPVAMYFVLSGEVRLVRSSRSGSDIVLQRAREGILAEASLDQARYHCDAIASARTTVLRLPRAIIRQALTEERFGAAWRVELSRELRRLRAQCERLSLNTARERIVHYIETEGKDGVLTLTQSKKQWAVELGLTHEAVYRTLAQMQKSSAITVTRNKIRLAKSSEHTRKERA